MDDVEYLNRLVRLLDEFYDEIEQKLKFLKCWRCGQAIIPRERNTCFGCGPVTVLMFEKDKRTQVQLKVPKKP